MGAREDDALAVDARHLRALIDRHGDAAYIRWAKWNPLRSVGLVFALVGAIPLFMLIGVAAAVSWAVDSIEDNRYRVRKIRLALSLAPRPTAASGDSEDHPSEASGGQGAEGDQGGGRG